MSVRGGVIRLTALVALAGACACAGKREVREVVFWQFWPLEVIQPIVERFEAEYPGIDVRVEQLTWDSGRDKITAAIAAGRPPDLCELGSTYMPRFLQAGALSDWSAGVADLRDSLRGWDMCRVGDALYGLPWVLGTRALFYDKTLFARAGLDSSRGPETWSEVHDAAARIQRLGGGVHGYGVSLNDRQKLFKKFMPYAWGNGGDVLSPGLDSARVDSRENREALEFYLSLRAVGTTGLQDALDKEFKEGRLGMQISGAWLFKQIPKEAPGLRYGVTLVPRPAPGRGTHASFAGGEVLASFKGSARKEDALRLARFLVRPENSLALAMSAQSVQPARVGADTASFYRDQPGQAVMIRQFESARFTPNHPRWDEMEEAIEEEVEQALFDRKTAKQALVDAHARVSALLRR